MGQADTYHFGDVLRAWRKKFRYSQLALGLSANVSARHISFLESGRAQPSREMVLHLSGFLQIPKAETNRALLCAGFAPEYIKSDPADSNLYPIHNAISTLLTNHMPFPAIALDAVWNVTNANIAAQKLLFMAGFDGHKNLLVALAEQSPTDSRIVNWEEVVALFLYRLRCEVSGQITDPELLKLIENLEAHFEKYKTGLRIDHSQPVIPTCFELEDNQISLFSAIAQFGTVQDITLNELKVELMFPADDQTQKFFQELAY